MKSIPPILATLLLLASGYVHGMWTGRWQVDNALEHAATAVQSVPKTFGDWELIREMEVSAEEKSVAELAASVSRQYRNQRTGDVVSVLLMAGKSGPIAVHPPTACYTGLGYQQIGVTRFQAFDIAATDGQSSRHQFQVAQFASPQKSAISHPHVFWAWSADGVWSAPDNPRLAFVGKPVLFKLYVSCETNGVTRSKESSAAEKMVKDLIPVIRESVFVRR